MYILLYKYHIYIVYVCVSVCVYTYINTGANGKQRHCSYRQMWAAYMGGGNLIPSAVSYALLPAGPSLFSFRTEERESARNGGWRGGRANVRIQVRIPAFPQQDGHLACMPPSPGSGYMTGTGWLGCLPQRTMWKVTPDS